jgi:hypothetical protein
MQNPQPVNEVAYGYLAHESNTWGKVMFRQFVAILKSLGRTDVEHAKCQLTTAGRSNTSIKNLAVTPNPCVLLLCMGAASVGAQAQIGLNLEAGWNLLGNTSGMPVSVATTFGDASKIKTVWKWNRTASKWAFYAPSMTPTDLANYAQGKSYDVLAGIYPKEGFWVNASSAIALSGSADGGAPLVESDLKQGWNLIGSADNKTPSQLNQSLGDSLKAAGKTILTVWSWDATSSKWKFYAPVLETQGGTVLADYINSKSYLPFGAALSGSDGFWVNVGLAPTPTTTTTTRPSPVSSYEGNYSLSGGGINVSFSVQPTGTVTCSGNGMVVCSGQVSAGGTFTISGNDGQSPVDTAAILTGTIDSSGNITGSFTANSVSGGPSSGGLTGRSTKVRSLTRISIIPDSINIRGTSASASMPTSQTGCVSAIGTYSDGTTDDITSSVTWTSSDPLHATMPAATSGNCALITGYIVEYSLHVIPMWPLGIFAGETEITARDPKTGIQGNLLLTVERGLDEGSLEIPLGLAVTWHPSRPEVDGRAGYVTTVPNGSNYVIKAKPLGLYAVRITDYTNPQLGLAVNRRSSEGLGCSDKDVLLRRYIRCIERADAQGKLHINVTNFPIGTQSGSNPTSTFRMSVQRIDSLINVGSFESPVNIGSDGLDITEDAGTRVLTVGSRGCSYYSVPRQKGRQSLTFRDVSAPSLITLLSRDLTFREDTRGDTDVIDRTFEFELPDEPRFNPIIVKFCSAAEGYGSYYGSTAKFSP